MCRRWAPCVWAELQSWGFLLHGRSKKKRKTLKRGTHLHHSQQRTYWDRVSTQRKGHRRPATSFGASLDSKSTGCYSCLPSRSLRDITVISKGRSITHKSGTPLRLVTFLPLTLGTEQERVSTPPCRARAPPAPIRSLTSLCAGYAAGSNG